MSSGSYIDTDPKNAIPFVLEQGKNSVSPITITNIHTSDLLIKIKSNQRTRFSVKPTSFLLKSNDSMIVDFTIKSPNVDVILDEASKSSIPPVHKDKFQILALSVGKTFVDDYLSIEDTGIQQERISKRWKSAADSDQSTVILKVDYKYPEGFFKPQAEKPVNEASLDVKPSVVTDTVPRDKYENLILLYSDAQNEIKSLQVNNESLRQQCEELKEKLEEQMKQEEEDKQKEEQLKEEVPVVAVSKPNYFSIISIIVLLIAVVLAYFLGQRVATD